MFRYADGDSDLSTDRKTRMAEWFLAEFPRAEARDLYRWVWEGEFGRRQEQLDFSLDLLTEDIRRARIHPYKPGRVWEPSGLAGALVKVNLVAYADGGYPLKRLLMMEERVADQRPNPMRFKHDWAFMKSQLVPGMSVTQEQIAELENNIPIHLSPDVLSSEAFLSAYGLGYRIVPRLLLFGQYEEFLMQEEEGMFQTV